jgi:hypothetical protein
MVLIQSLLIPLLFFVCSSTVGPVLPAFSADEIRYEKYAAALAATEPIRKLVQPTHTHTAQVLVIKYICLYLCVCMFVVQRDRRARQSLLPLEFWLLKVCDHSISKFNEFVFLFLLILHHNVFLLKKKKC